LSGFDGAFGKLEREQRSAAGRILGGDMPSVCVSDLAGDGEAEAGAGSTARRRCAEVALEHVWQVFVADPKAVVADRDVCRR
jgi:hypothetical protein